MKTRPLCYACLFFLLLQSVLLILTSGESLFQIPASSIFREGEGRSVSVTGQVYAKSNTSNSQVLYLKNNSITYQNQLYDESKVIVYIEKDKEIPIGKTVRLTGNTILFSCARNPGNFDSALYYARQGLYGGIFCEEIANVTGHSNPLKEGLYQCKCAWKESILKTLGEETGGVLSAMLLGETGEMDEMLKERYQAIGIGHILAISGLHISFIGLGLYRIFRKMELGFGPAGFLSLSVLTLYVLMVGWSVSVLRAYIMLVLRIGADVSGRVYDGITALFLCAAITVGLEPLYLTDGGFYMSYGAILGIFLLLPVLEGSFRCRFRWLSGVYASLAINLMLFPLILWFYFEFPTYSLLWNLLVIPLMSLVMGFGMLGSLMFVCIRPVGVWCLQICGFILRLFGWVSETGSGLPLARMVWGKPAVHLVVVYYVLLFGVLWWNKKWKIKGILRRRRWILPLVCVVGISLVSYRPNGDLTITMLDVGQGDGIFIESPAGTTYFIDGGSSDEKHVGKYQMESFLKSQGVGKLDYVFLTHGDTDHYNGIVEILERQQVGVRIETLVLPANFRRDEALLELAYLAGKRGVKVGTICAGEKILEGEFSLLCLQPGKEEALTDNAGSMVLAIRFGEFAMLCTGDVEGQGETSLIPKVRGMDIDVLKVAHHGSKYSTSEEFLEATGPDIALISAGKDNPHGHPHKETLERLDRAGCRILQTAECGAITMQTDGKSLRLTTAKD